MLYTSYLQAKMTTIIRNRTLEISATGLTVVLFALTIMTYFLDQNKSNWVCGPVLFLMELIALGLQTVLTVSIWKTTNRKTKFALLLLSILIIGFVTYGFVNFNLNCT
jgi:cytochrome bd-type quinol oxidase subunit 2